MSLGGGFPGERDERVARGRGSSSTNYGRRPPPPREPERRRKEITVSMVLGGRKPSRAAHDELGPLRMDWPAVARTIEDKQALLGMLCLSFPSLLQLPGSPIESTRVEASWQGMLETMSL